MFSQAQRPVGIVQLKFILFTVSLLCLLLQSPHALTSLYCPHCKKAFEVSVHAGCPKCCYQASSASNTGGPSEPGSDDSEHSNHMALDLFLHAAQIQPEASFVFSPYSLFQALTFLLKGADGETLILLKSYLGQICHYQEGITASAGATPGDVLIQGAAMVLADGIDIQPAYQQFVNDLNVNMHKGIDFSNRPALRELAKTLNEAISELTHGMITNLCNPNAWNHEALFIILTSVYFHGTWKTPLECHENCGTFTLPDQQKINLKKVLKKDLTNTQYAKLNDWQAVAVPYEEDYEMVFILPPHGTLPHQADSDELKKLLNMLTHHNVNLQVPPFNTQSHHDLEPLLKTVGLGVFFYSGGLSMGNMLAHPRYDLSLGQAIQQCSIIVDEYGTTAAAATELSFRECYVAYQDVIFDRPFMYVLRGRGERGRILFTGQEIHPEAIQ